MFRDGPSAYFLADFLPDAFFAGAAAIGGRSEFQMSWT
jgi:hypothetical protein